jgi:putative membrane protein
MLATLIPSPQLFGPTNRFTANMSQFVLGIEIGTPLLLLGLPAELLQPLRRWDTTARRFTAVLPAGLISTALILAWHLPAPFEAASGALPVWLSKQVVLLVAGLLGWWPVTGALLAWRAPYPAQLLYLFLMRLPMALLGALLTFADRLIYNARPFGVEICAPASLGDQQAAGVVMWSGGGLIFFVAFTLLFFRWASTQDVEATSPL